MSLLHTPSAPPASHIRGASFFHSGHVRALQSSHILWYDFPDAAFQQSPIGVLIEDNLSSAVYVAIRLIAGTITITDEVKHYATLRRLPPLPALFKFPFHANVNFLRALFPDMASARKQVMMAQEAGRQALDWVLELIKCAEEDVILEGSGLPAGATSALDFYRCLTWRGDDAATNDCRALVPYDRSNVPAAGPALPLAGAGVAYTPAQPRVLPRLPAAAEPAVTAADLNNLFSTLMGQRGVSQGYLPPQGYAVPTSSEVQVEEID